MSTDTFTILVVCTGNVCRSPLAHQLLSAAVMTRLSPERASSVVVHSAGTEAPVGAPMSAPSAAISVRLGNDPTAHCARQLTVSDIRSADLILVASRQHRKEVAQLVPRATRTLFTIREFARIAETLDGSAFAAASTVGDLRETVARVAAHRGYAPIDDPALDDIVDPIGRSEPTYERMASELVPAIATVSATLFG
jgi:protein-tyrosine phosphatase